VALLEAASPDIMAKLLIPMLEDPSRLVRTEAARVLTRFPNSRFTGSQRRPFQAALDEYKAGLMASGDRAGAHMGLGLLAENQGLQQEAREAYETAIRIEPTATGARTNLAAWHDLQAEPLERQRMQAMTNRDEETARRLFEGAMEHRMESARLRSEELQLLARDARLAPDNAPVQYRYGLSLYLHGDYENAEAALLRAATLEPTVPDFVLAVALLYEKQKRWREALDWTNRLLELEPDNPGYTGLKIRIGQGSAGINPQQQ
jgi:tetratricopeptide (TPR) repeat protein